MTEVSLAFESVSQNLQVLGLLAPAIGCCMAKLAKSVGSQYFTEKNYYQLTGMNLITFLRQEFAAHDHPFGGLKPGRNQCVVLIPIQDAEDKILVNKGDITPAGSLNEGDKIPETPYIHRHNGTTGFKDPWEY